MEKKSRPLVNFWKPTVSRKTSKSSKINFVSPVNLKSYPSRTKREIKLIDKNPWGDFDRDHSINYFDCRPMNKKKQGKMIYQFKENPVKKIDIVPAYFDKLDINKVINNPPKSILPQYAKERYAIPEVKEKIRKQQHERYTNPEVKEQRSKYNKKRYAIPEVKEKMKKQQHERYAIPEVREEILKQQRKYHKERYAIPEVKEKISKYHRERYAIPEVKEKRREINATPEAKEKRSKYAKERYTIPEVREKINKYAKERYAIPEIKEKMNKDAVERYTKNRIKEMVPGLDFLKSDDMDMNTGPTAQELIDTSESEDMIQESEPSLEDSRFTENVFSENYENEEI